MIGILYSLGYIACVLIIRDLYKKRKLSFIEKSLVFVISIIPMGKLIYLSIPGLIGLKLSFIISSIASVAWIAYNKIKPFNFFLIVLLFIPLLSMVYIENMDWIWLYRLNDEQTDSSFLRLVSLFILLMFSAVISSSILKNKFICVYIAEYYILGTIYACFIGIFISYLVFNGAISVYELLPISAGTHIVGSFYRFNPGANVNEFSMILVFAIFMLPFTRYSPRKKFLLLIFFMVLQIATLTRGSWIGLLVSVFFSVPVLKKNRLNYISNFLSFSLVFIIIMSVLYFLFPDIKELIDSRTSFALGASGEERIEKFKFVFDRISESPFRFLFGFGWATNMYVHNVYLQLVYEIGVLGLLLFVFVLYVYISPVYKVQADILKFSLFSCLLYIFILALVHHTLYHIQTWFIIGFVAGFSRIPINNYIVPERKRRFWT
jgi:hypothetical protein